MRFAKDTTGSEVRPDSYCDFSWNEIVFNDVNTYYQAPLTFYFREGVNTITLESSRDSFYLDEITLFHAGEAKSYEDVVKEYAEKGYTAGNAVIHLDAETPDATSNYTVYPDYDRSSRNRAAGSAAYHEKRDRRRQLAADKRLGALHIHCSRGRRGSLQHRSSLQAGHLRRCVYLRAVKIDGSLRMPRQTTAGSVTARNGR